MPTPSPRGFARVLVPQHRDQHQGLTGQRGDGPSSADSSGSASQPPGYAGPVRPAELFPSHHCGVEQSAARRAHNPKVASANLAPATNVSTGQALRLAGPLPAKAGGASHTAGGRAQNPGACRGPSRAAGITVPGVQEGAAAAAGEPGVPPSAWTSCAPSGTSGPADLARAGVLRFVADAVGTALITLALLALALWGDVLLEALR